jgi:hypothetical protein
VTIALRLPGKEIKEECARLLEALKQWAEAAELFEKAECWDNAAIAYIKVKNWFVSFSFSYRKYDEIVFRLSSGSKLEKFSATSIRQKFIRCTQKLEKVKVDTKKRVQRI